MGSSSDFITLICLLAAVMLIGVAIVILIVAFGKSINHNTNNMRH